MTSEERENLAEIIEKEDGNSWWKPDLFLKNIRDILPKELEILENPPMYEQNYNCFVYVFGLEKYEEFLGGKNPVQQGFIKYLLWGKSNKNILQEILRPEIGDFVFYEDDNKNITHAAIYQGNGTVISKWMWGPIIKSKLWDAPSIFGNKVLFTKKVNTLMIKNEYEISRDSGAEIPPIS